MLMPRLIPLVQIAHDRVVKTRKFGAPSYVGEPRNVVMRYGDMQADEVIVVDIFATRAGDSLDFAKLEKLARYCPVPLAYGGGIGSVDDARRLVAIGVEKVVLNSAATREGLVEGIASLLGSQAVVISIDVRRGPDSGFLAFTHGGQKQMGESAVAFARAMQSRGAGELLVQSIDRDGTRQGYDFDLCAAVSAAVSIPVIACGGAASRRDMAEILTQTDCSAAAAGSLFCFLTDPSNVLLNYPSSNEKEALVRPLCS